MEERFLDFPLSIGFLSPCLHFLPGLENVSSEFVVAFNKARTLAYQREEVPARSRARRRLRNARLGYLSAATKLSITNFRPALSKSTVNLEPSIATTAPGPNLL
jgi:hypothetical protein